MSTRLATVRSFEDNSAAAELHGDAASRVDKTQERPIRAPLATLRGVHLEDSDVHSLRSGGL